MAKLRSLMLLKPMIMVISLSVTALADDVHGGFQAFYFIQQWLGSYCNQQGVPCCYPETGKPAGDFTIAGFWPYYSDGSFPENCPGGSFDEAPLKPLQDSLQKEWTTFTCPLIGRKFWLHEWNKRGVCSKSILDEIPYFQAALDLKNKINLLQVLTNAGIKPENQLYPLSSIKQAISSAVGFDAWVACNHNAQGHSQIWQITLCADNSGTKLINCPNIPAGPNGCDTTIQFPTY